MGRRRASCLIPLLSVATLPAIVAPVPVPALATARVHGWDVEHPKPAASFATERLCEMACAEQALLEAKHILTAIGGAGAGWIGSRGLWGACIPCSSKNVLGCAPGWPRIGGLEIFVSCSGRWLPGIPWRALAVAGRAHVAARICGRAAQEA